jgi:UDP-glucose 4-epimerase
MDILGFEHKTQLKDGLTRMWEWAQKQPQRERFAWEKYEIEKGIYSFWKDVKGSK